MKKLSICLLVLTMFASGLPQLAVGGTVGTEDNSPAVHTAEKYILSGQFRVLANDVRWHQVYANGSAVRVGLLGDGYTNVDLYIYDSKSNLIASSTRPGYFETTELVIHRSGYFWVKVVNQGTVYSDYAIMAIEY